MSPKLKNQSAKSQEKALAAFVSKKAEIDALARAVSDAEAERWLEDAVDRRSTARHRLTTPRRRSLTRRSSTRCRCARVGGGVASTPTPEPAIRWTSPETADQFLVRGRAARRETATVGGRQPALMAVAMRLFSLAELGLLDHGNVTRRLDAAARPALLMACASPTRCDRSTRTRAGRSAGSCRRLSRQTASSRAPW